MTQDKTSIILSYNDYEELKAFRDAVVNKETALTLIMYFKGVSTYMWIVKNEDACHALAEQNKEMSAKIAKMDSDLEKIPDFVKRIFKVK